LSIDDAGKGSGGFAVMGAPGGKGNAQDILYVTPATTGIYTIDGSKKFMGGFTVFGLDTVNQDMTDLFQVTANDHCDYCICRCAYPDHSE
jgi:hypothetical protein